MTLFQVLVVIVLSIIIWCLYKIFYSIDSIRGFLLKYTNTRHGIYSAYTLQDISEANATRAKAQENYDNSGGFEKLTTDWVKELISKGKTIESIIYEANKHTDLEIALEETYDKHMFMLQANIDVARGHKNIGDIYNEERDVFYGIGIKPSKYYNKCIELKKFREKWIRDNFDQINNSIA